jgi:TPR repeat protein
MKVILFILIASLNLFAQEEESEAMRALRLSCQQNVGLGCYNYANMLLKRDQQENANKYFEMGCKLEHSDSCVKKAWDPIEAPLQSETISAVAPTAVETGVSPPETASTEESIVEETPTPAPASIEEQTSAEEPISVGVEGQVSGEAPSEVPSPDETELDLSAIE